MFQEGLAYMRYRLNKKLAHSYLLPCLIFLAGCASAPGTQRAVLAFPENCNVKMKANDYMCNSARVMAVRREGALVICQAQCAEHANWQQNLNSNPIAMQLRTYDKGGSNAPNAWIWQENRFKRDLKSVSGK
jgi:hypothetical protein